MNFSLENVVSMVVAASPLLAILLPYLYNLLAGNLSAKNRELVKQLIAAGVNVAEQTGSAMAGEDKKKLAMAAIDNLSKFYGVKVDPNVASDLIEEVVSVMNQTKALASGGVQTSLQAVVPNNGPGATAG